MADRPDERLKALKASMKVALGKLTGSDELEAQGARERSGAGARKSAGTAPAKKRSASRTTKGRPTR